MTRVMAIDPGTTSSGWLVLDGETIVKFGKDDNERLIAAIRRGVPADVLVIEKIASFGMSVGAEIFETVRWSGRFEEAAQRFVPVGRLGRIAIKTHLCHSAKAKDGNVWQALVDRFGGSAAKGTKAAPGPLYGIHTDVRQALAVAVAWSDGARS